jgi:Swiss Army Knife RNA repair-like protein
MSASAPPVLLIDVDGVLSLFGFDPLDPPRVCPVLIDGTPHWLSADAGAHLRRLAATFECIWCTGWEERAEEHLPRLLALPGGWTHLSFRQPPEDRAHWKLAAIDDHAGADRPLAWIDDAHDDACRAWARDRPGPTLLISTDPAVGLTAAHVAELETWALRSHRQHQP